MSNVNPQQLLQLSQFFQPQLAATFNNNTPPPPPSNNIFTTPQQTSRPPPDLSSLAAQVNGATPLPLPAGNNINTAQLAALRSIITSQQPTLPVDNHDLPAPTVSMPTTSLLSNQQPACCAHVHTYPRQRQQQNGLLQQQMQQLRISNNNNYERTFSRSCPGSRNGSPTHHSCAHCPLHSGHHLNGHSSPSRVSSSSGYGTCYSEDDFTTSYTKTSNHVYNNNNGGYTANGHLIENTCFGSPNPRHESVLANALLNDRPSKEYSRNSK